MKAIKWRWELIAPALVLSAGLLAYGCYQTARANVNYTGTALNLNTTAGIQFNLANLPSITDNNANGDNTAKDMKVFFSLGDGTFWMGKLADFNSQIFPYTQTGTWKPYAELTSIYDDDKNPTGRVAAPDVIITNANVSALSPLRVAMGAQTVMLQCNREPKPGDSLLYIITYEHNENNRDCPGVANGTLNFSYDPNVLVFKKLETFHGETERSGSASATNNTGQVLLTLPAVAAGTQHSVFVRVAVKETATAGGAMAAPVAQVNWRDPDKPHQEEICSSATSSLQNQQIVSSHDPNHKIIRLEKICETDNLAKFTVTFQNDGTGPTQKVIVEDELDQYLADSIPEVTEWSTPQKPLVDRIGPRLYQFVFNPLQLRGLNEPKYGTEFTEAATKASFTFTCKLNTVIFPGNFPACNAVMNRAKIFFDCNPPVITNDALLPVNCVACDSCSVTETVVVATDTLSNDTIPMNNALIQQLQQFQADGHRFHWYPCSDVSDWQTMRPLYTGKNNNRLTLVVSKGESVPAPGICRRWVYNFVFPDPCHLKIEVDETNVVKGNCAGVHTGFLVARVFGAALPSWNSCAQKDTIHIPVQAGKTTYYIGVTDLTTGCFADSLYTIQGPAPLVVDDVPGNCRAKLIIRGGVPPYTVQWTWEAGGIPKYSNSAGTTLSLRGRQNVKAVVTDANGCVAVFTPQPNTCPLISRQELLLLVAALAIALLWPILRYLRQRRA